MYLFVDASDQPQRGLKVWACVFATLRRFLLVTFDLTVIEPRRAISAVIARAGAEEAAVVEALLEEPHPETEARSYESNWAL
mmetsp:Transcript_7706/g.20405  ORF Transcript_7706/g.20405 Transcript_7706/m.20405 type:complete len:82 (+) Transcript_7706:1570-1815(+)